jgi:hypothetical protein
MLIVSKHELCKNKKDILGSWQALRVKGLKVGKVSKGVGKGDVVLFIH